MNLKRSRLRYYQLFFDGGPGHLGVGFFGYIAGKCGSIKGSGGANGSRGTEGLSLSPGNGLKFGTGGCGHPESGIPGSCGGLIFGRSPPGLTGQTLFLGSQLGCLPPGPPPLGPVAHIGSVDPGVHWPPFFVSKPNLSVYLNGLPLTY